MHRGYIKLWRKIEDSEVWSLPPLDFKVWIWLLTHAAYKPRTILMAGVTLEPGDLTTTYREIADGVAWKNIGDDDTEQKPTTKQLRTVLQHLYTLQMLAPLHTQTQGFLHLRIINWKKYQSEDDARAGVRAGVEKHELPATVPLFGTYDDTQGQGVRAGSGQGVGRVRATLKEGKNVKNEKKEPKTLVVSEDEQDVFDRWKVIVGANGKTKLDAKRLKAIRWGIDTYGLDGAMETLAGLAKDSWALEGSFSRREIEMVFRNATNVERFMNQAVTRDAGLEVGRGADKAGHGRSVNGEF